MILSNVILQELIALFIVDVLAICQIHVCLSALVFTSDSAATNSMKQGEQHGKNLGFDNKRRVRTSHTEPHAKERGIFARQLADYLNIGVAERLCSGLVLIASSPMLGELRPLLSGEASKVLRSCVTSDLTRYTGDDLKERVDHALRLPD